MLGPALSLCEGCADKSCIGERETRSDQSSACLVRHPSHPVPRSAAPRFRWPATTLSTRVRQVSPARLPADRAPPRDRALCGRPGCVARHARRRRGCGSRGAIARTPSRMPSSRGSAGAPRRRGARRPASSASSPASAARLIAAPPTKRTGSRRHAFPAPAHEPRPELHSSSLPVASEASAWPARYDGPTPLPE